MSLQILADGVHVNYERIRFSDGSSNVKVEPFKKPKRLVFNVNPTSNMDDVIWEIFLVGSAIEELFFDGLSGLKSMDLFLPYLPHGRADRVFETGNSCPLSTFIHFCVKNFDSVTVIDPHSNYLKEVCEKEVIKTAYSEIRQWDCFRSVFHLNKEDKVVLVSPDKGAENKTKELWDFYRRNGFNVNVAFSEKVRDLSTGEIQSIEVEIDSHIDVENSRFIIVDDICDGGGTFLGLSKKLREKGAKTVELYVTHGIFSKGFNIFRGLIDKIYCYQTVSTYVTTKDILDYNTGKETK